MALGSIGNGRNPSLGWCLMLDGSSVIRDAPRSVQVFVIPELGCTGAAPPHHCALSDIVDLSHGICIRNKRMRYVTTYVRDAEART